MKGLIPDGTTFKWLQRKFYVVTHICDGTHIVYILKYYDLGNHHWCYEAWEKWDMDYKVSSGMLENLKVKE